MQSETTGRLFKPAFFGATIAVVFSAQATLLGGLALGCYFALKNSQLGWVILSGPIGLIWAVQAILTALPVVLVISALWVAFAVGFERFILRPGVTTSVGAIQGVLIGVPGILLAGVALSMTTLFAERHYTVLIFGAVLLSIAAPGVAGGAAARHLRVGG